VIGPGSRPRLASKARLRFDPHSGKHLLLYPERGLELTETATRVAKLCADGLSVTAIVDRLVADYGADATVDRARVEGEVLTFLRELDERGLLVEEQA
jgi:coenzyme PQQ biosynthesis protein PqqD